MGVNVLQSYFHNMPKFNDRQSTLAYEKGAETYQKHKYSFGNSLTHQDIQTIGGQTVFLTLIGNFYKLFMENEITKVLFDKRHDDTNVSPEVHGRRLGLVLLDRMGIDTETYARERGNLFRRLNIAHNRAKQCPLRSKEETAGIRKICLRERKCLCGW